MNDERARCLTCLFLAIFAFLLACFALATRAKAHDIYTGVHGRDNQLCCGGSDCAATLWREKAGHYEFLTRERTWIEIPQDRITFLPVPGEPDDAPANFAHLCYRPTHAGDNPDNVFGDIYLYCAFIKPGGV